jgi:hypothetical protein
MKHAVVAVLVAPLLLAGCVVTAEPPGDSLESCGAVELQSLVGQPGEVLDGMRFSQDVRVIQPGMAVTMDYSAERLNIWLNDREMIERVTCG